MSAKLRAGLAIVVVGVLVLLGVACSAPAPRSAAAGAGALETPINAYVVRRSWHSDVGFAVEALPPALAPLRRDFPGAHYLLFGFGDRRYLLARNKASASLPALFWPAPGLILATGLSITPEQAFGSSNVVGLALPPPQLGGLGDFIRNSLQRAADGEIRPYADGPYPGSRYYASPRVYSALHTCNTWSAQALQAAGLPVNGFGVLFAFQLWSQLTPLRPGPWRAEP